MIFIEKQMRNGTPNLEKFYFHQSVLYKKENNTWYYYLIDLKRSISKTWIVKSSIYGKCDIDLNTGKPLPYKSY